MSIGITNRERMLATLAGEVLDRVPSWINGFFNTDTIRRLIPSEFLVDDLGWWPQEGTYGFAAQTLDELDRLIGFNRYIDRVAVAAGRGANHAFGHGGPGEFNSRVIERTERCRVIEYETGARARIHTEPHFYHLFEMPVKTLDDLERLQLPDPEDPDRWHGFGEEVAYLRAQGEYTVGYLNGFFSGCHTFFCDYQEFMMSLILQPEFVDRLLERLGQWNLGAARMMLEAGVDCIGFCDDLGSGDALLFRPDLYDRYFFPWHRALCDLAHSYGAQVHMHSHGNITKILDRVVATGVDMLNPLDPTEGMDLAAVKERYGDHLTLAGGIHRQFLELELDEMERSLRATLQVGADGGRFILMDACGIPEDMPRDRFDALLDMMRRVRERWD
jgi:uroporphyrinogen decarboxylase